TPPRRCRCTTRSDAGSATSSARRRATSCKRCTISSSGGSSPPGPDVANRRRPLAKVEERSTGQPSAGSTPLRGGPRMALIMTCECGEVLRAETEDDLITAVERHVASQHPDLVGAFSRDDIIAMAEMI